MGLCLKNVKENLGNLANSRDNQGNVKGNVYPCFFNQLISKMLGKICKYAMFFIYTGNH